MEKQLPARREKARAASAATGDEARELLAGIDIPESVPAPLVAGWRSVALTLIRRAMVAERAFGKTGAVGTAKKHAGQLLAGLPPGEAELRAAVDAREPVKILGKAHWPHGSLRVLGHDSEPPAEDPAAVAALRTWLRQALAGTDLKADAESHSTAAVTGLLTGLVRDWADAQPRTFRHNRWIGYRELTVPVTPGGARRYGRLDVVVNRPGRPDLVIEIDSAHNPRSVEKLLFARDAGAVPIWIRWLGGSLHEHPDITVIDLRAAQ
ncbi:hypothetical protein GCM10009565_48270 [Amycolatopsis albidoflavus]